MTAPGDDSGLVEMTLESLQETPAPPIGDLPIQNPELLPLEKLQPEVLERLVAELVADHDNLSCNFYGRSGQAQHGLDIVERRNDYGVTLYQVKRFQSITLIEVQNALEVYAGEPANGSDKPARRFSPDRFVVVTSARVDHDTMNVDGLHALQSKYEGDLEIDVWGAEQLSRLLRTKTNLVHAVFGPAWAQAFCGTNPSQVEGDAQLFVEQAGRWLEATKLPPQFGPLVDDCLRNDRPGLRRIMDWTGASAGNLNGPMADLLNRSPAWLRSLNLPSLQLLGMMALACKSPMLAVKAWRQAADITSDLRRELSAAALLIELENSESDVTAEPIQDTGQLSYLAIGVNCRIAGDLGALPGLATVEELSDELQGVWGSFVASLWVPEFATGGQLDDAVLAARLCASSERSSTLGLLLLAACLVHKASTVEGLERRKAAEEALELAVRCRDLRRLYGARSDEAVAVACRAASLVADLKMLKRLAIEEATDEESRNPEVRASVAMLDIDALFEGPQSEFERHFVAASNAAPTEFFRTYAVEEATQAAILAENDSQLWAAHTLLADLGVLEPPRLDEWPDGVQTQLNAVAHLRNDDPSKAIALLRPLAGTDRPAAYLLMGAYAESNQYPEAAQLAKRSADRFEDAQFVVAASRYLIAQSLEPEALATIEAELANSQATPHVHAELRLLHAELCFRLGHRERGRRSLEAASAAGVATAQMLWSLVEVHADDGNFDSARELLERHAQLQPTTEVEQRLLMDAHSRGQMTNIEVVLDLLERETLSEQLFMYGIGLLYLRNGNICESADEQTRRAALLSRFTDQYPDSGRLGHLELPEDPEEMIAAVRAMVLGDPARQEHRAQLDAGLARGSLPVAAVGEWLNKSYHELAFRPYPVNFLSSPPISPELEDHSRIAVDALDKPIVIDQSVIVLSSQTPLAWTTIKSVFTDIHIPAEHANHLSNAIEDVIETEWLFVGLDGQPAVSGYDDQQKQSLHKRAQWIRTECTGLTRVFPSQYSQERTDAFNCVCDNVGIDPTMRWLEPVRLAFSLDTALLTSDLGLARLAATLGIQAFGVPALLLAVLNTARASPPTIEDCMLEYYRAGLRCLPTDASGTKALAIRTGLDRDPLCAAVRQPEFWAQMPVTLKEVDDILYRLAIDERNDDLRDVAQSASHGIAELAIGDVSALELLQVLLVHATLRLRNHVGMVPAALEGVRRAANFLGIDDPLPGTAQLLLTDQQTQNIDGDRASFVIDSYSDCAPSDKSIVSRVVLGITQADSSQHTPTDGV